MSTGFCVREGIWYKWHGHLRARVRHMLQPHPPINYSQYTVFYNGTLMPYKGLTKLRDLGATDHGFSREMSKSETRYDKRAK